MRRNDATRRHNLGKISARKLKPTVEGVEKRILLTTFIVRNTNDDNNPGSLRYAIGQSNATPGTNTINFDIAASGLQTIAILTALPTITVPVTIDGTTERGYANSPLIELNGSGVGKGVDGLDIAAGNSTVRGLVIDRFTGEGISLSVAGSDTISNNFIGTNPAGGAAAANGLDGILVQSSSNANIISSNVISGNLANGIYLNGQAGGSATTTTSGNIISGNRIGVDVSGQQVIGNAGDGVNLSGAPTTTIGGTTASARNIVSGNLTGILVSAGSDNSIIEGNYVGTNLGGTRPLGNSATSTVPNPSNGSGIVIAGGATILIGGTAAGAGNVISGNTTGSGIDVTAGVASSVTIQGNDIGTNAGAIAALGNAQSGIAVNGDATVTIGGTVAGARNVISSNRLDGITIQSVLGKTTIQGNYIGTDITGTTSLGNAGAGVNVQGGIVSVGGIGAGAGNIIANNGSGSPSVRSGVFVQAGGLGLQNPVPIQSNSIYNNQNLGIELSGGANNNQVPPVLTSAVSMDTVSTMVGSLTAADGTYSLQFFATPTVNPSGNAEGKTLIGTSNVTVVGGVANFTLVLPSGFTPGSLITATATDSLGNTSEFSGSVIGTGSGNGTMPPQITVTSTPSTVFAGQNVTDTFTITDISPVANLGVAFSDAIPTGTAFFSGSTSTGAPLVVTNGVANASIGTLTPGQSVTVTIVLTTLGGAVPSFTNIGSATSTTPTVTPGTDTASATTAVTPAADLSVAVNGPLTPTPVGQNIVYQVTVGDNGASDATGVTLVDTLPANVTFVSASSSAGPAPTESGGTVTDAIGTLPFGQVVVVTITVATIGATAPSITDTASVSGTVFDPDPTNNTASVASAVIASADLTISSETASPTSVIAGQPVTLTINVGNNGLSAASGVVVTDRLPAGLTFLSGTAAGGAVTASGSTVTAPVGTLAAGAASVVTILVMASGAGTVTDSSTVSSPVVDPVPGNNSGSASVTINPQSDLSIALSGPTGPFNTGNVLTYTAVVTNSGPSPATNALFTDPLFVGASFQSVSANGVSGTEINGVVNQPLGTIAAGTSVTVVLSVIPTQPGTVTNTAQVSAAEPDPNLGNNTSSVQTTLIVPAPIIEFAAPTFSGPENGGFIAVTLTRVGDTSGNLSVHFSTVPGGNGTPGVDYQPVSTIVQFPAGVSSATVDVPVLENPFDNHDEYANLQIDTPTGGAVLANGAVSTSALLQVIDIDPVRVGPTVTDLKLIGPSGSITGVEVDTSGNLNAATAVNAANYSFLVVGSIKGSLPVGTIIPASLAAYNPATGAVVVLPSTPLPANEVLLIDINGTRPGAVTDRAGNPLNSVLNTTPASDYTVTFARGNNITYKDETGASVNLKLTGPGVIDIDRTVAGQVGRLQVVGPVARRTVISGTVHPRGRRTTIGSVFGLGQFGSIKTNLNTPPFYLAIPVYPNSANLVGAPSVDTLLPSSPTPASTSRSTRHTTKAKPTTPVVKHASPTPARTTAVRHGR